MASYSFFPTNSDDEEKNRLFDDLVFIHSFFFGYVGCNRKINGDILIMSASSSLTTSMSDSSQKLCIACETRPYDLICTCAGKFCFTCIHTHVEQLDIEFHFVRNELGQRLLQLEQTIDDNKNENAKTIIENWVCI